MHSKISYKWSYNHNFFVSTQFLFYLLTVFLNVTVKTSRSQGPACVTYYPKIPNSFSTKGDCNGEVGKIVGTFYPNQNFPTTVEEIELQGYNVSTHTIVSEDGYIQTIYRILGAVKSPPSKGKQSVLLFHGAGGGSAGWIIQPGSRNLAFLLTDSGYEVWLANARGTTPSLNHTHLDPNSLEYWNFSFEEMGTKDLPLLVNLMIEISGNKQVYYVCHSLGCTFYLAGLSELPLLSVKFKAGFLLAPSAYIGRGDNPFFRLLHATMVLNPLATVVNMLLGGRMSIEPNEMLRSLGLSPDRLCTWSALRCGVCDNALFAVYGADALQINYTNFPNMLRKTEDNLSLKSLFHGLQDFDTCQFRKFNYGAERNLIQYGSTEPPPYDVGRVRVPTYIFYGESDTSVAPTDAENLWHNIQPRYRKGFYRVNWPLFNHIDFNTAKDADVLFYRRILDIINGIEAENGA